MFFFAFFNQTFDTADLFLIGLLVVLEGVLSIDNALVLGLLARRLPKHQQHKALTYGLVGAFVFRAAAIVLVSYLMHWTIAKLLGGAYLVYVSIKHFFFEAQDHDLSAAGAVGAGNPLPVDPQTGNAVSPEQADEKLAAVSPAVASTLQATSDGGSKVARFWPTVLVIELTDIAFAVDSILAAYAMVSHIPHPPEGLHPKAWVVVTGGMLGVILMRFAAILFIKLLERFPRFEVSAYLLVILVGLKLIVDWLFNRQGHHPIDFHSPHSPAFWIFWIAMAACFAVGFIPRSSRATDEPAS